MDFVDNTVADCAIREDHLQTVRFNVMSGMPVEERLQVSRYEIEGDRVRAYFSRSYMSTMDKSPSHLIFLSCIVQLQKMIYIYMCHRFAVPYSPSGPERFKIWPTDIGCEMSRLVRDENGLVQTMDVRELLPLEDGKWTIAGDSEVAGAVRISGKSLVIRI